MVHGTKAPTPLETPLHLKEGVIERISKKPEPDCREKLINKPSL